MKKDYIAESLSDILSEMGLDGLFDADQIDTIADDLNGSLENWGTFSGEDCIPNPLQTEISRLEGVIKKERYASESQVEQLNINWRRRVSELEDLITDIRCGRRR